MKKKVQAYLMKGHSGRRKYFTQTDPMIVLLNILSSGPRVKKLDATHIVLVTDDVYNERICFSGTIEEMTKFVSAVNFYVIFCKTHPSGKFKPQDVAMLGEVPADFERIATTHGKNMFVQAVAAVLAGARCVEDFAVVRADWSFARILIEGLRPINTVAA